ncbi:hypothetical protein RND71_026723 [Anisodus tanguticus]|uniref:RING-type E3 ubiquitin transferase n=1 Tax=Anisodus tanguticus TaxID=243964 RepID=A0AAE1RNU1_9SOLA|nr:hypothetical protein RND71_026723 [Anisodus tanguticus]
MKCGYFFNHVNITMAIDLVAPVNERGISGVHFLLAENGRWPQPEYVNVNMDGSRHPLPLVTVYHHLQPVNATPLTFLQALFGHHYPSITFMDTLNLFSIPVVTLELEAVETPEAGPATKGFCNADSQVSAEEETGDVPDGQLCVICLMRRRLSAFVPCGHLVCCQCCALSVERDLAPKCPLCRQTIRSSVRIYDS